MEINIEQVINLAKMHLVLGNTEYDAFLEKFINMGATHLKNYDTYVIKCDEISIDDNHRAKLPDFFEELLGISFPEGAGCACGECSVQGTTVSEPGSIATVYRSPNCTCPQFFIATPLVNLWNTTYNGTCGYYGNYFNVNGNSVSLPSTTNATSLKITYRSSNVDCDGIMILNEDWERGLACFAAFNYARAYRGNYTTDQIASWENEWKAQKAYQKGRSQVKRFKLDKRAIHQIMNAVYYNGNLTGIFGAEAMNNA